MSRALKSAGRRIRIALLTAGVIAGLEVATARGADVDFARDIRPILSENCFLCHGPDDGSRVTELRLDTAAGLRSHLGDLPLVAPQDPDGSVLLQRITTADPDVRMPPADSNKTLTPQQIDLIRRWIEAGAEYGEHWSLQPIIAPSPPVVSRPEWQANPIDAFVFDRLQREGLEPSPEAERFRLLRRVSLDLTGLPPTPAEVDAFLADDSPQAYERVVDRLLASPAYGERMAWDWLDAARYADSNGYQGDRERTMWPWRDWVVDAFNRNQPFDEFTVEQLAGDLLPDATFEQRLATAFCRNHMINGEGGRIAEENRVDYVMDMTETMGTVWLGLTLNCCRCHDHKFDALSKRDYFALFAFFNQTPVTGGGGDPQTPPVLAAPTNEQREELARLDAELTTLQQQIAARELALRELQPAWARTRLAELELQTWRPVVPTEARADRATLDILPDGSVLARGDNPDNDTYTLSAPIPAGSLAALRVEALKHECHTKNSLSRSDSGNFVLTGFEVEIHSPPSEGSGEAAPVVLTFREARATFEQGAHTARTAIDSDPQSGWAVWEGKVVDREHAAVFVLSEPVQVPEGARLLLRLRHDSPHKRHNLGRCRISTTTDPAATAIVGDNALLLALQTPAASRSPDQTKLLAGTHAESDPEHQQLTTRREGVQDRRKRTETRVPKVMVMADQPEPRTTFLLERGLYNQPGEAITAAVPASLPPLPGDAPPNRLALARWIVSDDNPLTARVTVNRLWQQLFGVGLVKTAEDFGVQGEIPAYAPLLDWLAEDFRAHGWDVQRLMRQIVTSRTYRQSSRVTPELYERDPENRLLARGPRYRLPSWMIRDQALAVSGLLVRTPGGPPVNGYQPAGVWEEATFGNKKYTQDHGDALYRRSLYTFWRRIIGPTMFFDNAARQVCTVKVFHTNTPLHALLTMNDVTYIEAARAFAQQTLQSPATDDAARIGFIFLRALSRPPTDAETEVLLAGLQRSRGEFAAQPESATKLLGMGESPRDAALDPVEHAAWTALCLAVLNLDETVTKE